MGRVMQMRQELVVLVLVSTAWSCRGKSSQSYEDGWKALCSITEEHGWGEDEKELDFAKVMREALERRVANPRLRREVVPILESSSGQRAARFRQAMKQNNIESCGFVDLIEREDLHDACVSGGLAEKCMRAAELYDDERKREHYEHACFHGRAEGCHLAERPGRACRRGYQEDCTDDTRPRGQVTLDEVRATGDVKKIEDYYIHTLHDCYEEEVLSQGTARAGKLVVSFIGNIGRLSGIAVSTFDDKLEGCVADQVERWRFPVEVEWTKENQLRFLLESLAKTNDAPAVVMAEIQAKHARGLKRCLKPILKQDPDVKGIVSVELTIAEDGKVVRAKEKGFGYPKLDKCVHKQVMSWRFSPLEDEEGAPIALTIKISLPFSGG
jgi:hypothetical protein